MIKWLIKTSLQYPLLVLALAGLVVVLGLQGVGASPVDVFPEFAPPLVEIQTEAPGLSTYEVESLVTVPIENALNGTSWLKTMRSKSVLGLSSVVLIFKEDSDLMRTRQLVQERLGTLAGHLPAVAKPPVILSPLSSMSRVMKIGVWSKNLSQMEQTTLARWVIRPRLMAIPGVANVAIWGERGRQLQVLVDPDRLRANAISLQDILRATGDSVSLAAGGFVDTPNQRLPVTYTSTVAKPADLALVPVAFRNGASLRIGDVAEVVEGFPAPIGDAVINSGPGLLLIVEKQPWGNTLEVTRQVETALAALRPALTDLEFDSTIFRPASFIEASLRNLNRAMLLGCALVIFVLVVFLRNWRTALISALAIPLSLLAALLVLRYYGATFNIMILAGLVIALGEVVDDAIIDVENITRRLRLNRDSAHPQAAFAVVLQASVEVRSAVVYATIIVILVFVPVFFLDGVAGSFFRPMAVAYALAVAASLGVALTVTPALSLLLLPRKLPQVQEVRFLAGLKRRYRQVLPLLLPRPNQVVVALLVIFAGTALLLPFLGEEFLPKFRERDFLMHWVGKPGTSLQAMRRITQQASVELSSVPGVRNFGSHIGRAEVADEVVGPNFTELWISLDESVDYDSTVAKIQFVVDSYPGLYRDLLTYLKERIKEVLTGASASIVVRIYGEDLDVLRSKATEVRNALNGVEGIRNLQVEPQVLVPQIEVRVRPEAADRFGLTSGEIRRAAATFVKGTKVGEIYEQQKIFDVVVWGVERVRNSLTSLREMTIETPAGARIPLSAVADVHIAPTPNIINREQASRRIDVICNVATSDIGGVAREVEKRVLALSFSSGYHPEFLGEYAARQQSRNRLLALALVSLAGIFLVLHTDFGSLRLALLVFATIPFALVGGVFAALLTGGVLSLGSLVGFVTVLGIAARNGIMLVSHYRHLEREEGVPFGSELVSRGAEERLTPILMTALATALALIPIAVAGSKPGQEIEHPMAVVILGGLVTSTLLNLLVVPGLYLRYAATTIKGRTEASSSGLC